MIDARQTVSKHSVSLDQRRRSLEPSLLNKLLETLFEDNEVPINAGKKRRAEDLDAQMGSSKRQKFTDAMDWVRARTYHGGSVDQMVPAFKHTYDFVFTLSPPGTDNANADTREDYRKEIEVLRQTLLSFHKSSAISNQGDIVLPLTVKWSQYCPGEDVRYTLKAYLPDSERPLISVDVYHPPERHHESGDYRRINPIAAAYLLEANHGVHLTFSVRLQPTPDPDHSPEHALPLKISIELEGSLHFPQIAHPSKNLFTKNYHDAWDALIRHLFPPRLTDFPSYHGETDITFLYSSLEPAPSLPSAVSPEYLQPKALLPSLLPFQRRSVLWMLNRERKTLNKKGKTVSFTPDYLPLFWEAFQICGRAVYLNRLKEILSLTPPPPDDEHPGGSLNEAPGLGKTVECLALILLNPDIRRNPSTKRWDSDVEVYVREVHTTLIITPATLASQWQDELKRHTPSLKVLFYEGWSKFNTTRSKTVATASRGRSTKSGSTSRAVSRAQSDEDNSPAPEDSNEEWCSYINKYDVCITTYNVLTNDLHVARPPARRPRRDGASYANTVRQRSPLVTCEWYRVIMDEVQMAGGAKTEEMVSRIPRLSSFAVSGTPARSRASDLIHVLKFLRAEGISTSVWNRLLRPEFVGDFLSLFRRLAIRTTKSMVRDELGIPEQTRYLVPVELGRVEKHFYDQHVEQALLALGFDARGVTIDERSLDPVQLRSWIRKLRGICTHPQVGQLQNTADKKGAFKSIEEVLESMRENGWKSYMEERRNRINRLALYAQLQKENQQDLARYHHALETLLAAEIEANALIEDLRSTLEKLSSQASKSNSREQHASDDRKGKGKERESSPDSQADEEEDVGKRNGIARSLREAEILLHKVTFFMGDLYHTLGAKYSKEEDSAYAKAELIRKKLLKVTEENAVRAIAIMVDRTVGIEVDELLLPENYLEKLGIPRRVNEDEEDGHEMEVELDKEMIRKSTKPLSSTKKDTENILGPTGKALHKLVYEADAMIVKLLNAQTNLLWQWRTRLIELLTRGISSESGEDADGREYTRSLETQREAETYLDAYSVLLNDRRDGLFAEKSLLAAHEGRGKFRRATVAAMRALGLEVDEEDEDAAEAMNDLHEAWPEDEVLQRTLMEERLTLLNPFQGRALKSVMVDLSNFVTSDKKYKSVAADGASLLRDIIASQMKHNDKLDADLVHFRRAFKERLLYFRQLQEISDSVIEAELGGNLTDALIESKVTIDSLGVKIKSLQSHQRYLDNLSGTNATGEEDDTCIVCRCEFLSGFVTRCAHVFCEDCLKSWLSRKEGKVCPVCRVPIDKDQLQKFSVKGTAPDPGVRHDEKVFESRRVIKYNDIDPDLFSAINEVECLGSYGTKIETLIRHLLYLQKHEPDSKSIVFSAWADSLHIIDHALNSNGIPSIRIEKGGKGHAAKAFKENAALRVMLLHGERENAGLNIVCASRVFLLESVVNHAFEVQAIARIDRLSQTQSTQVFCYYAKDTVERNILDLAVRKGLSLYTKGNSGGNLPNFALASTTKGKAGQKGDFISSAEDMLAILFPHLFEDLEFLVPGEDDVRMDEAVVEDVSEGMSQMQVNAEAGPSRLG